MTPERIEQERKAFEEWYINYLPPDSPIQYFSRDYTGYRTYRTRTLFEGWLACAAQSEWISVEDERPETETTVLVRTERGYIFTSWASDVDVFWFYDEEEDDRVTHWQPLPAPPTTDPAA